MYTSTTYTRISGGFFFLGHNTDGKYFVTSNKMSFRCETRPRKVNVFIEKARDGHIVPVTDVEVRELACGANHTVGLLWTFIYSSSLRQFLWNCLSVCKFEMNMVLIEGLSVDVEFVILILIRNPSIKDLLHIWMI